MKKHVIFLLGLLISLSLTTVSVSTVNAQLPPGISRGDTLIVQQVGKDLAPTNWMVWKPNEDAPGVSLCLDTLWYWNYTTGQPVGLLANGTPAYSADFKSLRIYLRRGIYWSDGVELTSDDVLYTMQIHLNVSGLTNAGSIARYVQNVSAIDKYTVSINLKDSSPKFALTLFTTQLVGGMFIMPKHIFEKAENVLTFKFFPPVGTGPYVLKDYDEQGYWTLWERRTDWARSSIGMIFGKPKPKYIFTIYYGTMEKFMIAMSRHELDWGELSYEMITPLTQQNPYARAWWSGYPYAWLNGICDVGVEFQTAKYPYNITDVRWALTLAINMTEVQIGSMNAMARIATFRSLSTGLIEPSYVSMLLPLLKNFTLPDGYKPFDPTVPDKIASWVRSQGYTLPASPQEIYSQGWWKYDPAKAAELLQKNGFYKDASGKWHLPDGTAWSMKFLYPGAWLPMGPRVGIGIVEQWTKFGLEMTTESPEPGIYWPRRNVGDYDAMVAWPLCSAYPDPWTYWNTINKIYYKPLGEVATNLQCRWVNDEVSNLLDQMAKLTPNDPQILNLTVQILMTTFREMPIINFVLGSKMISYDQYVWTGFPTGENRYFEGSYWGPDGWKLHVLTRLQPTGKLESEYTAAEKEELTKTFNETITSIASSVKSLSGTVSVLQGTVSTLNNQIGTLTTIGTAEIVVIVVLAAVIIITRKK